jgi:hypothetical protein
MKHVPFQSIYRQEFEVVEERQGRTRLYPHTDQLPLLWRALDLEFRGALPGRIARVDQRADDFHKILLRLAALMFSNYLNTSRADELRLFPLSKTDRVTRVAIVQQITEETRLGRCHRFRFYGGEDFFPEIRLSGKRLVFADHVLQRFSARVPNNVGEDLSRLLLAFFGTPMISLPVGPGRAFIVTYDPSILAFTYKETATEFFITTCLTINEMNSLGLEIPPRAYNLHYGETFTVPKIRNWIPTLQMKKHYDVWQGKVPLRPPPAQPRVDWHRVASWIKDLALQAGHGPGSRLCFTDHVPGPCLLELRPGQVEWQYDELAEYKKFDPSQDWDAIFAERDAEGGSALRNGRRQSNAQRSG